MGAETRLGLAGGFMLLTGFALAMRLPGLAGCG